MLWIDSTGFRNLGGVISDILVRMGAKDGDAAVEAPPAGKQMVLRSLAPQYQPDDHRLYLRHLTQAVEDPRNRNIALTGPYGTGKSSVLDEFVKKHAKTTVRISISTLGPDENDEDLTNRIQKELVKQLVYRVKPGKIRRSRLARPKPLTKPRAFLQALGIGVVGLGLLGLLGFRPPGWPGDTAGQPVQLTWGLAVLCLVVGAVWGIRWLIGDRIVSQVSTAGTTIALTDGPKTYFDSFLDEIVSFFDAVEPNFVVFEDLDRFDDPQIFDSLRELNTLINASGNWKDREQPLRFIYAIKDSLFEKLGSTTPSAAPPTIDDEPGTQSEDPHAPVVRAPRQDVAAAAVHRANRTKFFELVIPVVPFISHRNARDLLVQVLKDAKLPGDLITRPLLDLVARHTTDMRLMINICNEFVVYAERLLWTDNPAPGMTADHLFALVVYKNFHLADFEDIPQRTSTLDTLEQHHRQDVRALITDWQEQRRRRQRTEQQRELRTATAKKLGVRLRAIMSTLVPEQGWQYAGIYIAGAEYSLEAVESVELWQAVARTQSLDLMQTAMYTQQRAIRSFSSEKVASVFPEVADSSWWADPANAELTRLVNQCDERIAVLQGAGFEDLASFGPWPRGMVSFDERIDEVLLSELARDLVRQGFLTRSYAEYSAVFYGNFVGVDVAFFYNHSVQPNVMYVDHQFATERAIPNLLEQAPEYFTRTVSALNLQVVSYVLQHDPTKAREIAEFIATHANNQDVQKFLDAFLNAPNASGTGLVRLLTEHPWPTVFDYLAECPRLPDESVRMKLFDAALLSMGEQHSYTWGNSATELIAAQHQKLAAIVKPQSSERAARIFAVLQTMDLRFADLGFVGWPLLKLVVDNSMYDMSISNLRVALNITSAPPTLDEASKKSVVWSHCWTHITDYLAVTRADESFGNIVTTKSVLIQLLNSEPLLADPQLTDVLSRTAESASIDDINVVPSEVWPAILDVGLLMPTLANVVSYTSVHRIDSHLGALFVPAGQDHPLVLQNVEDVPAADRRAFAVAILNASSHLAAKARVEMVAQLDLEDAILATEVSPAPDQLLARSLEAGLFPDDADTFTHFAHGGGWDAVSEAFTASKQIADFLTPSLIRGLVADFLGSEHVPDPLKRAVLEALASYIPDDDPEALLAAARFALKANVWLSVNDVERIARVTGNADAVLRQLVHLKAELDVDELIRILVLLGPPYNSLTENPGTTFDLPQGSSAKTVLNHLQQAGRVRIEPKPGRGQCVVILASA